MGCSPSGQTCKKGGVRLMTTKLVFTEGQLCNLNAYFRALVDEAQNDLSNDPRVEVIVERLIQCLMLSVRNLDRRFSSMFLISLNEPRRIKQSRFEYLLRIDMLSTPSTGQDLEISRVSVEEDASLPGFIRLKIFGVGAEVWREYMDLAGRLRRDLVKAKLANLLATAIKRDMVSAEEGPISAIPGHVVDAEVLEKILRQPDHCRIFYGPAASQGPLQDSRNHRVALIEDASGILLRIELNGFQAREVEVRLLLGIAVSSWPNLADYPRRISLYHCDALLHYAAAQTGMYAVAVGPHSGVRCEDRATLWMVRVPAAEKIMSQHYAGDSVPSLTESVLLEILYELRGGRSLNSSTRPKVARRDEAPIRDRLRVVSRHIVRTVHRWALERVGPDPLSSWAPDTLSRHVLLALDELVAALKRQSLRCYFYPRCNLMFQCARGFNEVNQFRIVSPCSRYLDRKQCRHFASDSDYVFLHVEGGAVHHEDSYLSDCRVLESYLERLHYLSFSMTQGIPRPLDVMESELIARWRDVVASLPRGTTNENHIYSQRQLEYFSLILEQVLRGKDALLQTHTDDSLYPKFSESSYSATEQVENLVVLLQFILTQARDQLYAITSRGTRNRRDSKKGRSYHTPSRFDYSVGLLIDVVRRDRETANMDLECLPTMTKTLLQWLHFAMEHDRKVLEPILYPYLNNLFNSLHEYSWFSMLWKQKQQHYASEMQSLSKFCKSVVNQEISPADGIVEYLSKGCCWAESMTKMIEETGNSLSVIFLSGDREIKCNLTFSESWGLGPFSTWSKARSISAIARRRRTNYRISKLFDSLSELRAVTSERKGVAGHTELRDVSPLTYVASMSRSGVRHRGPGDLISAMISLGKFTILQEVAALLPQEEQVVMLDMVRRAARESARCSRKNICAYKSDSPRQIYRPRQESDFVNSSPPLSPRVGERCIIAEHRKQLEREMQEMQDTLRRNALMRVPHCVWDSHSVSSWNSSIDSIVGTITLRKYRAPIWDVIKGSSSALVDPRVDRSVEKNKFGEMISREESPTWSTLESRRTMDNTESKNGDELPSWDTLEATLNRRLCNYGDALPESLETDQSIRRNCVETSRE